MGLAITTRLTQIVPLPRSLTRRSGAVAAINMALPMECKVQVFRRFAPGFEIPGDTMKLLTYQQLCAKQSA